MDMRKIKRACCLDFFFKFKPKVALYSINEQNRFVGIEKALWYSFFEYSKIFK